MTSAPDHHHSPLGEFAADDGSAPEAVATVLHSWAGGRADAYQVVAALRESRLLVPLVPVLDPSLVTVHAGLEGDKDSHLATPIISGTGGRRGIPSFTSLAAMAGWQDDARPVPTATTDLARSAIDEDVDAVIVDPLGPVTFTITRAALEAIAVDREWMPAEADPVVRQAISEALVGLGGLAAIELGPDPDGGDIQVVLVLTPETDPMVAVRAATERLFAQPVVRVFIENGLALGYRTCD